MKAIWYDRTGPAREVLQYGDLPTPIPGNGQALIRIRASGVNPSDAGARLTALCAARHASEHNGMHNCM